MPQILIETRLNSLKLTESTTKLRKGCLGRIEGICADFVNPTRNGRFYSRKLWENVVNDELFKESLATKTLIGELDHPEERFETLAQEACVVMTDYKFTDDALIGGFDILDTVKGRTLKALLDYGCVMGVSSRGQGDITDNGDYEDVDPDSYDFAGFDVVLTPAVKKARQKVVESNSNSKVGKIAPLTESLSKEIASVNNVDALDSIAKLIESAKLPNSDELISAISDKRKSIEEGKTISEQTKTDLHNAKIRINQLEKKVKKITTETIREKNGLNKTISEMTTKILAYQHREGRLTKTLNDARKESVRVLRKCESASDAAKTANKALKSEAGKRKTLEAKAEKLQTKVSELTESVKSKDSTIAQMQSKVESLQSKVSSLTEKLETSKANSKRVVESADSKTTKVLTENKTLKSELRAALVGYASALSTKYGLTESAAKSLTKNCKSVSEVEVVIKEAADKRDRYSKLPFSAESKNEPILVENSSIKQHKHDADDAEWEDSKKFIELASGIID